MKPSNKKLLKEAEHSQKKLNKDKNRRGGKGGGDGLNVTRRTPYLT